MTASTTRVIRQVAVAEYEAWLVRRWTRTISVEVVHPQPSAAASATTDPRVDSVRQGEEDVQPCRDARQTTSGQLRRVTLGFDERRIGSPAVDLDGNDLEPVGDSFWRAYFDELQ